MPKSIGKTLWRSDCEMPSVNYDAFAIDWSSEPCDERERRIRKAVITRVMRDSVARSWELECLADDPDSIADDLRCAIETARTAEERDRELRRLARNAELVRLAIADAAAEEIAIVETLQNLETAFTSFDCGAEFILSAAEGRLRSG